MSNHEHQDSEQSAKKQKGMSRRQFLSYTLGGTTAFMMGVVAFPSIRFGVDAVLAKSLPSDFIKVMDESEVTSEPREVKFKVTQVDAWYRSEVEKVAWISRDESGKVFALSPICKHLGCTVLWNAKGRNEYDCPCHDARYTKDGKQIKIANAPLDEYQVEIQNGVVYLGGIIANTRV